MHTKVGFTCTLDAPDPLMSEASKVDNPTMMSPYKNRGNSRSRIANWQVVAAQSGELRGSIAFEGSVRAFYSNKDNNKHIKGNFTLERWTGAPTRYRISYNGFNAATEEDTAGDIKLPHCTWNPVPSKGASKQMVAHLLMMEMESADNEESMVSVQITIPVVSGGHRAAKTVFQAFIAADVEMRSTGESLVGRRI